MRLLGTVTCLFIGFEVTERIFLGKEDWGALFKPSDFFQRYRFVHVVLLHLILQFYLVGIEETWLKCSYIDLELVV